jgi:hypothetical protein
MHAAMLAVQFLRPHVKDQKKLPALDEFMFKLPEDPRAEKDRNALSFLYLLKSQAKKKKRT